MANEDVVRETLEWAMKHVFTDAMQDYFNGKEKYTITKFMNCENGGEYAVAVESYDMTSVELRYRSSCLPDGDLGWLVATFCTDSLTKENIINAIIDIISLLGN